jgi:hypothetical protein
MNHDEDDFYTFDLGSWQVALGCALLAVLLLLAGIALKEVL